MKKSLLFAIAAASVATVANGAPRQTNYTELTGLYSMVPNGLVHGNMLLADIDNDGMMELLVKGRDIPTGWASNLKYLHLDESGVTFTTAGDLADPDGCMWERILYPIDYNNDGNVDLLYASSWGGKLMQGDGTGNFTMVEGFSLDGEIDIQDNDQEKWYTGTLGVADFNKDGYPDIVTFCGNPRNDAGTPVIFFNDNGTGKFIKDENTGIKPQRGGTLCVGDYNADGNIDILVSGWSDDFGNDLTCIWKNDGTGKFSQVMINDKAGTEKGHTIFADLTGNGLLDVFITGQSCPNGWESASYVYKNNGDDTFTRVETTLPGCFVSGADWCDLNGDGTIDLVYTGEGMEKTVYAFNDGNANFTVVADKLNRHRGGAVVLAADINNNNVPDICLMGYSDSDDHAHFQIFNGQGSRVANQAPNAPTNLQAVADGNKTVLTWDAGSDEKASQGMGATPAAALRYNYYVKTTDGKLITAVPADPATGKLRSGDVNAASTARTVTLNIKLDNISEWGVQSIDGAKAASAFASAENSGVESIFAAEEADAPVEYFNLQGIRVAEPANGIYLRRQGSKTEKVVIR